MPRPIHASPSRLGAMIQAKVTQASGALSEVLGLLQHHEGQVRRARGETRQTFLRDALRVLGNISLPQKVEDPDLGLLSLEGLEEELSSLGTQTREALEKTVGNYPTEDLEDRIFRIEAVAITLDRAVQILRAPPMRGEVPVEQLQYDLGEQLSSAESRVRKMLEMLENIRDSESLKIASLRSQIGRVLGLLHNAGVVPKKGSRVWWESRRNVPTRNRLTAEATK